MRLSDLPRELIEDILLFGDPVEASRIAQCSRLFRDIVYNAEDTKLWRNLYLLQTLDDPRRCLTQDGRPRPPVDWKGELQRIVRASTVAVSIDSAKPEEHKIILNTFLDLTRYVPPLSASNSNVDVSNNLLWVAAILRRGFLDEVAHAWDLTEEELQLVARLHAYFGLTRADLKPKARLESRAFVYDMRKYHPDNSYGPFIRPGVVDWVHVQMIHHAVSMHIVGGSEVIGDTEFEYILFPMSLPSTQIVVEGGVDLDNDPDWAGITGKWAVSFCFCDHRELLEYNLPGTSSEVELDTSIFEDEDFREVFRSLAVDLSVVHTVDDPQHPDRPIIHFLGKMRDPSSSTINGSVRMIADNQVQWHFVSGEPGNAIWSSEGVQVGGIRSVYGVLGAWTTVFHDRDDPVGPFWMRKLHNEDNLEDVLQQLLT